MVSIAEAVGLPVGASADDVDGILTCGYKNLRGGVKVQRDHPLVLLHGACRKLLIWNQWIVKLHWCKNLNVEIGD